MRRRVRRRLDGLRAIVGDTIVDELARAFNRISPPGLRLTADQPLQGSALSPALKRTVCPLPKREVTADFFEMVRRDGRLVVAIGDAPMSGLKSAFVARFVATLFKSLVSLAGSVQLGDVLGQLRAAISRHPYFERVSVQCME